jgi:hypothetical protein
MTTKISFLLCAMVCSIAAYAQTNTFPESGNVGIGTTSSSAGLDIVQQKLIEQLQSELSELKSR